MMYEFRRLLFKERNKIREDLDTGRRDLPSCVVLLKGNYTDILNKELIIATLIETDFILFLFEYPSPLYRLSPLRLIPPHPSLFSTPLPLPLPPGIGPAVKEAASLNTVVNANARESEEDLGPGEFFSLSSPAEDVRRAMKK